MKSGESSIFYLYHNERDNICKKKKRGGLRLLDQLMCYIVFLC